MALMPRSDGRPLRAAVRPRRGRSAVSCGSAESGGLSRVPAGCVLSVAELCVRGSLSSSSSSSSGGGGGGGGGCEGRKVPDVDRNKPAERAGRRTRRVRGLVDGSAGRAAVLNGEASQSRRGAGGCGQRCSGVFRRDGVLRN